MMKASRPMTYKHLTVEMISSKRYHKSNEQMKKHDFESLLFFVDVLTLVTGYTNHIRPCLNPACNCLLLICRNGKQISKLTNMLGRIVYEAVGNYINTIRCCQNTETESIEKLETSDQSKLSEEQKHGSAVAKTQERKLEDIAAIMLVIMLHLVLMIAQKLERFLLTGHALKKYLSQKCLIRF